MPGHARGALTLIHGAWLTSRSWEHFASYFEEHGYEVSAPEWPRKQGDVEEIRGESAEVAGLGLDEIVDHYAELVAPMDPQPILIGHSFGGLVVEILLDRGLGRAAVAMSPAPPRGILALPFSTLEASAPALSHPSTRKGVVDLSLEEFTFAFANTFTPDEAAAAYERYAVPETGRIFFEAGFANFHLHPATKVHFGNNSRAPLLILGADEDNTVPAKLARKQYEKYKASSALTDYLEFPGRPHLMMAAEGWREIATAIDGWLANVLKDR